MQIIVEPVARMTIEEFAHKFGLTIRVDERSNRTNGQWYAHFLNAEIKDGPILIGDYGYGVTPKSAIADYAERISGKLLVINAYGPNRREVRVPMLVKNSE